MPQGRRKLPYSGKAKKLQLQEKRNRKENASVFLPGRHSDEVEHDMDRKVVKINDQSTSSTRNKSSRYALQFFEESEEVKRQRKEEAYLPLSSVKHSVEITVDGSYNKELDFPKRPQWNYDMSPQQVELQEQRYFTEYISRLEKQFKNISYFELNLETWRQFWRVLEMSDVILFIVDIRFPVLMFPPSLFYYVTGTLNKYVILVLNKVDLAPPSLVLAWKNYFTENFPGLHVLIFTSFPGYNLRCNPQTKSGFRVYRQKGRMRMAAEGAQKILDVCREITEGQVDLRSWQEKITQEIKEEFEDETLDIAEVINVKSIANEKISHEKFQDGILTIGCLGYPNAGKSSLLNALMGKKVVSVSRTPGHTKHFQTIFLTSNVKLCDCPGLVFPSLTSRTLQVLMGSFPIAQLREPFSSIKFLAEHLDLVKLLSLQHPDDDNTWSAFDICNAWAQKRGFFTARAARPDCYRAANHLLRMALEGKICLCLHPPEYSKKKDFWENHHDIDMVKWVQAQGRFADDGQAHDADAVTDDDDDDDSDIEHELPAAAATANSEINKKAQGGSRETTQDNNDTSDNSDEDVLSSNQNKFAALDLAD